MVVEVWLLLVMIEGRQVYLDTFETRYECRISANEANLVERAVQIEGKPECVRFVRVKDQTGTEEGP